MQSYFWSVFGLNTNIYSVNLRIQFEYRKIRTRITPYLDTLFGFFAHSIENKFHKFWFANQIAWIPILVSKLRERICKKRVTKVSWTRKLYFLKSLVYEVVLHILEISKLLTVPWIRTSINFLFSLASFSIIFSLQLNYRTLLPLFCSLKAVSILSKVSCLERSGSFTWTPARIPVPMNKAQCKMTRKFNIAITFLLSDWIPDTKEYSDHVKHRRWSFMRKYLTAKSC